MEYWIVAVPALFLLVRFLWRAYNHPAHTLGRQAAQMNWVAAGTLRDPSGYRNTKLSRGPYEAVISYEAGNVRLMKPPHSQAFGDFVEVERWLASRGSVSAGDEQVEYFQRIQEYITTMGWYDRLLMLQGTDPQFCEASLRVYRAGFSSGQPYKVVGALIMESVNKYSSSRALALEFLKALEEQFVAESEPSS
jgi:hypothetical protein